MGSSSHVSEGSGPPSLSLRGRVRNSLQLRAVYSNVSKGWGLTGTFFSSAVVRALRNGRGTRWSSHGVDARVRVRVRVRVQAAALTLRTLTVAHPWGKSWLSLRESFTAPDQDMPDQCVACGPSRWRRRFGSVIAAGDRAACWSLEHCRRTCSGRRPSHRAHGTRCVSTIVRRGGNHRTRNHELAADLAGSTPAGCLRNTFERTVF